MDKKTKVFPVPFCNKSGVFFWNGFIETETGAGKAARCAMCNKTNVLFFVEIYEWLASSGTLAEVLSMVGFSWLGRDSVR